MIPISSDSFCSTIFLFTFIVISRHLHEHEAVSKSPKLIVLFVTNHHPTQTLLVYGAAPLPFTVYRSIIGYSSNIDMHVSVTSPSFDFRFLLTPLHPARNNGDTLVSGISEGYCMSIPYQYPMLLQFGSFILPPTCVEQQSPHLRSRAFLQCPSLLESHVLPDFLPP